MCINLFSSGGIKYIERFSYKDVERATDGFHRIMYSDSNGCAYKARFRDGTVALIKEITDGEEKEVFYRKVQQLARLHHRHLLGLRGFCFGTKRFYF